MFLMLLLPVAAAGQPSPTTPAAGFESALQDSRLTSPLAAASAALLSEEQETPPQTPPPTDRRRRRPSMVGYINDAG
ncbi:MAG TPA: hypothetical protein VLC53_04245, partial [Myxococcota bacterium]|nr:hypothetical protein [Myxococcota bacterium]